MALYKYNQFLQQSAHDAFDQLHEPGTQAPYPGVYRCHACGDEISIAGGHVLPPQNHHQHKPGLGRIQWRLIVNSVSQT